MQAHDTAGFQQAVSEALIQWQNTTIRHFFHQMLIFKIRKDTSRAAAAAAASM